MTCFTPTSDFQGDKVIVSLDEVDVASLLGKEFTIPEKYWSLEQKLPREYDVQRFSLRQFTGRKVSWQSINRWLWADTLPVGWRAVVQICQEENRMPLPWVEQLGCNGGFVVFPYAICHEEDSRGKVTVCCAAIFYNPLVRAIQLTAPPRPLVIEHNPIAVYETL